jgi:hypothetical protein
LVFTRLPPILGGEETIVKFYNSRDASIHIATHNQPK